MLYYAIHHQSLPESPETWNVYSEDVDVGTKVAVVFDVEIYNGEVTQIFEDDNL